MVRDIPFPHIPEFSSELNKFICWFVVFGFIIIIIHTSNLILRILLNISHLTSVYRRFTGHSRIIEEDRDFTV